MMTDPHAESDFLRGRALLAAEPGRDLASIAFESGFASHARALFRQRLGVAPGRLRRGTRRTAAASRPARGRREGGGSAA